MQDISSIGMELDTKEGKQSNNPGVHAATVCVDDENVEGLQLCPVTCFRPDPVCGEDGVTYWCGCKEAKCAGVAVSHVGFCKIRSSATTEKGSQALLLLHALWLALLGFSCLLGFL
ncbi:hypothetical protein KP509_16G044500 [Ceratopteris richardii]|nr:hypothetical protein KP509_16G044500 [Ceratopteris richardii]